MRENNFETINGSSELNDEKTEIPLKDEFFMSDFEKYYKYGHYPYMLFLQVILVTLSTAIVTQFF